MPVAVCSPSTGSPLQFYADAVNSGHVSAFGPGLSHGTANTLATFTIVTKDTGEGNVSLWRPTLELQLLLRPVHLSVQVGCRWLWRVRPRLTSPVRTIKMGRARCPTSLPPVGTTTSWSNLMTSTSLGARSQPGSPVLMPPHVSNVPRDREANHAML